MAWGDWGGVCKVIHMLASIHILHQKQGLAQNGSRTQG